MFKLHDESPLEAIKNVWSGLLWSGHNKKFKKRLFLQTDILSCVKYKHRYLDHPYTIHQYIHAVNAMLGLHFAPYPADVSFCTAQNKLVYMVKFGKF